MFSSTKLILDFLTDLKVIGKKGQVEEIDEDGDVKVSFGEYTWVMNPECLSPYDGKPDMVKFQDSNTSPINGKNCYKTTFKHKKIKFLTKKKLHV